ncbi:MAG: DUF29 domain-containing protein [Bryobacteraceae bacterium]
MNAAELYDQDFAAWAERNAELLRAGRVAEADLDHIAEEIEDMARRERRALESRLARLIQHLLKWRVQPMKRSTSWQSTIAEQRFRIGKLLEENPSFRPELADWIGQEYEHAVYLAMLDTGLERDRFPSVWPYTVEQTLDREFLPE